MSRGRRKHDREGVYTRRTDHPLWRRLLLDPRENWYRDVWLVIVTGVVYFALSGATDALHQQQEGRRIALTTICAVIGAVSDSGRATIEHAAPLPPRLEGFLETYGYPPLKVLERAAVTTARAYVRSISEHVHARIGSEGDGLVKPDGTIDCAKLERLARVPG